MSPTPETACHTPWWALYIRLSREDGDKTESLSVAHQKMKLTEYAQSLPEITKYELYIDDGWTGTNFERPEFQRLLHDIREHHISGIIVKDLSRLGRDNTKTGYYIHEFFPSYKVRFIAIDDRIDKDYYDINTSSDMMIDVKNMFNGFYPRDISHKVRSTFRTKQRAGQFIGAFACYGYRKSPEDHNKLFIDEPAASIVRQIYAMYLAGNGQNTIARKLNSRDIPCPSEYKKQQGLHYHNSNRLKETKYWTYSSIRNILRNEMYTGVMVQNKSFRQICKKKAVSLPREEWIIVPDTHEAIIDRDTFDRVQYLLTQNTRQSNLSHNIHPFAGLLKCGECGRAMCRIHKKGIPAFCCGSYNRYGTQRCSAHYIQQAVLEKIILDDFHTLLDQLPGITELIDHEKRNYRSQHTPTENEISMLRQEINRLIQKKAQAYGDYTDGLICREDFIQYRQHYEEQIHVLKQKETTLIHDANAARSAQETWTKQSLKDHYLEHPDRCLLVEMVRQIDIYQNHTIQIHYNFSDQFASLDSRME